MLHKRALTQTAVVMREGFLMIGACSRKLVTKRVKRLT
jgi:hypothetical protein